MSAPARFITIPFSHYVEKARWALDRTRTAYLEERYLPIVHWVATLPAGAKRTVPVLVTEGRVLTDSTDILKHLDARAETSARKLYPEAPDARRECEELEDFFDEKLGPDTRRVGYFHLLGDRAKTANFLGNGIAGWQRSLLPVYAPLATTAIRRGLNITPKGAGRSMRRIDEAFARVEQRLADGRRYLMGDALTAADITFAALAGPVLGPAEYGCPLPPPSELTPALVALVEKLRATKAGEFALRVYREDRRA